MSSVKSEREKQTPVDGERGGLPVLQPAQANDETEVDEKLKPSDAPAKQDDIVYPRGVRLFLTMMSIFIAMFLVTLDRLIIATAVPQITNEFNAAGDIGWYGTAYLLTNCAFQLFFSKLYAVFDIKATFMTSIVLFETGSAVCGAAPNSFAFVFGRAIAGLGAGGIMAGVIAILVYSLPLHKRLKYQGFFGGVFAVASVMGPLVGGAFTTNVTWRWCFYLNLPIGGAVFLIITLLLHIPKAAPSKEANVSPPTLLNKLRRLDALGMLAFLPAVVCLCLALQWGGTTYSWGSGRVVALLVVAFVLLLAFVGVQFWLPENQVTLPPRILLQRSVAGAFLVALCMGAHMIIFLYYLPVWFQAVKGISAVTSGIDTLPMMMPIVVGSIGTGMLVPRIGYYVPFLLFGIALSAAGAGLLTALRVDTSTARWAGYQLLYGFGLGFASQVPNMAAQTVLPRPDVALGASVMFFGQQLAGAVFTSVGQNVLDNQLATRLADVPGLGLTPQQIQNTGATNILALVPAASRPAALLAYNAALRVVFRAGLITACIAVLGGAAMEWRNVKKKPDGGKKV
ncbi:Major facilitator superfamily domain, general substrate transporter [Niveomyces insectorum RCEF 264]|uniref:Major facilitator superfamily domain, general substrate transporter n=1 Tax=Niveomyces insectorum RCEF 264 TaxID=1081102 RepID=A0A162IBM0_9HYPO|nr:Major facilitator superfamily domain, general substrate transporter [Niveomyces insectorum RCEF 264]